MYPNEITWCKIERNLALIYQNAEKYKLFEIKNGIKNGK